MQVRIDPLRGAFAGRLLVDGSLPGGAGVPRELAGRWSIRGGIVATAVVIAP